MPMNASCTNLMAARVLAFSAAPSARIASRATSSSALAITGVNIGNLGVMRFRCFEHRGHIVLPGLNVHSGFLRIVSFHRGIQIQAGLGQIQPQSNSKPGAPDGRRRRSPGTAPPDPSAFRFWFLRGEGSEHR